MSYRTGALLVIASSIFWSLSGLAIRQIGEAGPWAVLFWRTAGAAPVIAAFVILTSAGRPLAALRATGMAGVLGGIALVSAFGGGVYALQTTTIANAVFLLSGTPCLAALLGWAFLREPVRPATWAAIAIAATGVFVMVREGLSAGALAGNLAGLASSAGFAAYMVTLRSAGISRPMPVALIGSLFTLAFAAAMIALGGEDPLPPARDIGVALFMGAVLLASGMVLFTLGIRALPAAEGALLGMGEVLLAPFWVWLFLNERASAATLAGGAMVLVAVVLMALAGTRRAVQAG